MIVNIRLMYDEYNIILDIVYKYSLTLDIIRYY